MSTHKVISNQSLLDIALMYGGNVDSVFDIIKENEFMYDFTSNMQAGTFLSIPSNFENTDIPVKEYFTKKQTEIATIDALLFSEIGDFNDDFNNDFY